MNERSDYRKTPSIITFIVGVPIVELDREFMSSQWRKNNLSEMGLKIVNGYVGVCIQDGQGVSAQTLKDTFAKAQSIRKLGYEIEPKLFFLH